MMIFKLIMKAPNSIIRSYASVKKKRGRFNRI